ncbi:hypothetical protein [Bernardetia sp.]|uniref:hypothetical protein n=1 Tax=Bernardetia sp. TaxID=1937974 RepID=UPI0025BC1D8F|nr:hypothetical protein [Bernardetia sp.]
MKFIKKLNPLHPILPSLCLLIAFAWIGYDSFFKEKYTEEEKMYFGDAIGGVEGLYAMYHSDAYNLIRNMSWDFEYEYCLRGSYVKIGGGGKKLGDFVNKLVDENFYDINFSEEIPIKHVFESYIEEAKKLDILLAEKYKNFELEHGLSDKEINQVYFSHDSVQSMYHLARFKMQLAKMYHDDIELLIRHRIEKIIKEKTSNPHIAPYIGDKTGEIYLHITFPFDTLHTRIVFPKEVITQFDKKGHLIIPSSLRNRNSEIGVRINCSESDTTYYYKEEYEN